MSIAPTPNDRTVEELQPYLPYRDEDKNNNNVNRRLMRKFRRCINDLALKEIYLMADATHCPMAKILQPLCCSTACFAPRTGKPWWAKATCTATSNHSPLMLDCTPSPATHRCFRFKEFWLRMNGFHDIVTEAWHSIHDIDPFRRIWLRLQATAKKLTSWSSRTVGSDKMAICRELILKFDKAREDRLLSADEIWLHKNMKIAYRGSPVSDGGCDEHGINTAR